MEKRAFVERVRSLAGTVPSLARLLLRLARDPRVPRRSKVVFGAIGVYLVVPFDVIPDWLPGIGQLDDLALVALALDAMLNRVPPEVLTEHWGGDPAALAELRRLLATVTGFIPDRVKRWVLTANSER